MDDLHKSVLMATLQLFVSETLPTFHCSSPGSTAGEARNVGRSHVENERLKQHLNKESCFGCRGVRSGLGLPLGSSTESLQFTRLWGSIEYLRSESEKEGLKSKAVGG